MATITKAWSDGTLLTADYTGSKDGSIVVSSEANSGEMRSMMLKVKATGVVRTLTINQAGGNSALYKRVAYVQTDGNTLYDTGYRYKANTSFAAVVSNRPSLSPSANYRYLVYGGPHCCMRQISKYYVYIDEPHNSLYAARELRLSSPSPYKAYWKVAGGTNYRYTTLQSLTDDIDYAVYEGTNASSDHSSSQKIVTMRIFGSNEYPCSLAGARIHRVKVWESGVVVHNWVPAMRVADSAVGFYDLVDRTFIEPSSGSPIAGDIL